MLFYICDLFNFVAELVERPADRVVDDCQVTAAYQFFVFDEP